ncbi:MAG: hypothetical protein ACI86H_002539 [bacterium]
MEKLAIKANKLKTAIGLLLEFPLNMSKIKTLPAAKTRIISGIIDIISNI